MKLVFTIYDKVSKQGNNLFLCNNQDEAKRVFELSMKQQASQNPHFNPKDYTCYLLGAYRDSMDYVEGPDGRSRVIEDFPCLYPRDSIDLYNVPIGTDVEDVEDE